jgi:hypothetical protein
VGLIRLGGWIGVLTALAAWYASVVGVINGMLGRELLKVGRALPLFGRQASRPASPARRSAPALARGRRAGGTWRRSPGAGEVSQVGIRVDGRLPEGRGGSG